MLLKYKKLKTKSSLILLFCLFLTQAFAQDSYRMKMLSNYNNPNLPKVDFTDIWNDLTGYYDPKTQREYIICGSTDSVYFFDITDPRKMVLVDVESGRSIYARNRDFETYKHYAYCVSDQASGIGGLQIFDLQYLPDSVHKVYESNALGTLTHTIFIDSVVAKMYMSSNIGSFGFSALDVISLANPEQPVLHTRLKIPLRPSGNEIFNRVHEMYARNDTVYLSCEQSGLFVFDLRDPNIHALIGSITAYPDQGYNHSSWLDKTGKHIMFTDETMGMDVKIFDIKNLAEPKFLSQFNSNASAMPHNAYWYGDFAYVSAYHDGVRVYNVSNPSDPYEVAWFDTHPDKPEVYSGYKGCWGVYPFLPSKHIIASDLTAGIFVFEIDSLLTGNEKEEENSISVKLFPNPSNDFIQIILSEPTPFEVKILDLNGKQIAENIYPENDKKIDVSQLASGLYMIEVLTQKGSAYKKFLKW